MFDDASMWVAKTELLKATSATEKADPRFQKNMEVKGKNCCLPVLNIVEHLFKLKLTCIGTDNLVSGTTCV